MYRIFLAAVAAVAFSLSAQTPPVTPSFTEPASDGQIVSEADVHMVTTEFEDADGDEHSCTDWQIVLGEEVVWEAR